MSGTAAREAWLEKAAREALGGGRRLERAERLTGGSKKGVYRLTLDDASSVVAYVWQAAENYWPQDGADDDPTHPFSPGLDLGIFEAAHRRLASVGARVPRLYLTDAGQRDFPADLAIVEDLPGESLEQLLERDPRAAAPTMARLAEMLAGMREYRAPGYGKIALVDAGGTSIGTSCESVILDGALRDLAEAAGRDSRIAQARARLEARLLSLRGRIRPRAEYAVVHGELGPDHVRIDAAGEPVLIDIEGTMYFDVEWEHVFLRIRLMDDRGNERYRPLAVADLDEDRLAFYMLAQRLSLTAGPLRLLDGPFPNREFMRHIAEYNLCRALDLADAGL